MNVAFASSPFPIRQECPPGACVCGREELLADPQGDARVLQLTATEEKKLVARLEAASSYDDLLHVATLMERQLGIVMTIRPSERGVRTVRGIIIHLREQPGLCRKTRQAIPAAVRRCLELRPEIAWSIVDAHDLLGGASGKPHPN
jgi:hypothetical protein